MKAFIEILSGIIRVGPETEKYEDDYEYAVAFSASNGVAVIKGLTRNDAVKMSPAHYRAGAEALKALGLTFVRERVKKKRRRSRKAR